MQFTTLIPAYKPKYLVDTLTALRHQTVKPVRVVFSDDSPNQAFVAMLNAEPFRQVVADLHVEVVPGPRTGAWDNCRHLLQLHGGRTELFHLLLDDDVPYPTFYERHLQAHTLQHCSAVVSRRWTALENGHPLRELPLPEALAQHPNRLLSLTAELLFQHTVGRSTNWLGEFSNATFRADLADSVADASMAGLPFAGLEDLGAFVKASLTRPLGFINEPLGYFRTSAEQHSANPMGRPLKLAHLAYLTLALAAERLGQLTREQVAAQLAGLCPVIQFRYGREADMAEICALMPALGRRDSEAESRFLALWHVYSGTAALQARSAGLVHPTVVQAEPALAA